MSALEKMMLMCSLLEDMEVHHSHSSSECNPIKKASPRHEKEASGSTDRFQSCGTPRFKPKA